MQGQNFQRFHEDLLLLQSTVFIHESGGQSKVDHIIFDSRPLYVAEECKMNFVPDNVIIINSQTLFIACLKYYLRHNNVDIQRFYEDLILLQCTVYYQYVGDTIEYKHVIEHDNLLSAESATEFNRVPRGTITLIPQELFVRVLRFYVERLRMNYWSLRSALLDLQRTYRGDISTAEEDLPYPPDSLSTSTRRYPNTRTMRLCNNRLSAGLPAAGCYNPLTASGFHLPLVECLPNSSVPESGHNVSATGSGHNVSATGSGHNVSATGSDQNVSATGSDQNVSATGSGHNVSAAGSGPPTGSDSTPQASHNTAEAQNHNYLHHALAAEGFHGAIPPNRIRVASKNLFLRLIRFYFYKKRLPYRLFRHHMTRMQELVGLHITQHNLQLDDVVSLIHSQYTNQLPSEMNPASEQDLVMTVPEEYFLCILRLCIARQGVDYESFRIDAIALQRAAFFLIEENITDGPSHHKYGRTGHHYQSNSS